MERISSNTRANSTRTLGLVLTALFSAIVIILAFTPMLGYIPLGVIRATTVHIPVILGSILLGPKRGAFLGGIMGLTSLINNTFNPVLTSFVFTPFYDVGPYEGGIASLVICFIPRILIGVVPFYVYRLICGRRGKDVVKGGRSIVGLALAGLAGSLTNTLLVMNMIYFFFKDSYGDAVQDKLSGGLYDFILVVIGTNGVPEAIVAAVITLAVGKALMATRVGRIAETIY